MTELQKQTISHIMGLIAESNISEQNRKTCALDRKIGEIRSEADSPDLQGLHLDAGRICNPACVDRLSEAGRWLRNLNQ